MQKIQHLILELNRWLLILLLGAMSILIFTNVINRYITGAAIPWAEEVARHMMIWLTFLGCGLVLRFGGHIAIDNLQDALPTRIAQGLRIIVLLILLGFFTALIYFGYVYVQRTMLQTTAATEIPFGYIYMAMPIGCGLSIIHLLLIAKQWVLHRQFESDAEDQFDATASASL
ncbi:TRAP transporter small permease [Parvibium lacunae]|uniref:TRAP transporter small permease protein n=1 Tax=Parvibium lacunae TaxID=1888893 RepID=A0A368L1C2_9BURK|nr:TRAP transporter small permease [Parvibium lacunae]RCS57367.1 TRAP transporter small permease [Parvibium lacunae]